MVRDGWSLRRTVLTGISAVGASALMPRIARVRADDRPQSTPIPTEPYGGGAAQPQRAVLFEEDTANRDGRQFAGSAVWSAARERIAGGRPGNEMVLRAKVAIPDRALGLQLAMRRNTDKTLPATHTVDLVFELPKNYAHGGIENVPGMLAKITETARGVPLAGLTVKVTSGYFLIGLSAVETESRRNIALLKERSWLDVPIVYTDRRRAILAIEKGPSGARAFAEAFAAWEGGDMASPGRQDDHRTQRSPFPAETIEPPPDVVK